MGTFGDSWQLTKTSFRVIKEDKALLLFPLVSGLSAIGIIILFALGLFTLQFYGNLATDTTTQVVAAVLALIVYFALWIISIYFTGALVGAAMMKLNGGQPTFHDGMAAASKNLGKLIVWALIAGTVMLIIRAISSALSRRGGTGAIVGMIFSLGAGITWAILTYFMIPVLMFEQESSWKSIKRSAGLFRNTFGKTFISNLALGLILAAGFILGIVLLFVGIYLVFTFAPWVLGLAVALVGLAVIVFMVILSAAAEGVLVTALYRFATTGQISPGMIPPQYVQSAQASGAPLRSGISFSNTIGPSS
jgi:hypothetical protein